MPEWLLVTLVSAVATVLIASILAFWGKYIKKILANIFFTVDDDLNRKSESEYRAIMTDTVAALKERIFLLEKWKGEAVALEKKVEELEGILIILKNEKNTTDLELNIIRTELDTTKDELEKKEKAIQDLHTELTKSYKIIAEGKAVMADNAQKIQALLHQAGAEEPEDV